MALDLDVSLVPMRWGPRAEAQFGSGQPRTGSPHPCSTNVGAWLLLQQRHKVGEHLLAVVQPVLLMQLGQRGFTVGKSVLLGCGTIMIGRWPARQVAAASQ